MVPWSYEKDQGRYRKNLKLVDIVLEIIDARIPESSRNPMLDDILADKSRMIIMNKSDLADPKENQKWINKFKNDGIVALPMNSKERINVGKIYDIARDILAEKFKKHEEKDIDNPIIRVMIVGEPNSGKSTFINNVAQRKGTRVGNRSGVTQTKQWIKTNSNLQLLDTPGVIWPKFDDRTGLHLSYTNAIKDEILNIEDLTLYFIRELAEEYPENLKERYGVDSNAEAVNIVL